jgi:hypothetical protein
MPTPILDKMRVLHPPQETLVQEVITREYSAEKPIKFISGWGGVFPQRRARGFGSVRKARPAGKAARTPDHCQFSAD